MTLTSELHPPAKRKRTLGSLFKSNEDYIDSPADISTEQKVQSEVAMYLKEPRLDVEEDPLKWWKIHENIYPILANVARKYFCIPARLPRALHLNVYLVEVGRL